MRFAFCCLLALVLSFSPSRSRAEDFLKPTPKFLLQAALRFGALDINNDVVIDDYAKIAECDLYQAFGKNDFKWQKIRAGLRAKIKDEIVTYPSAFYVYGLVNLDRYDFDNKIFRLDNQGKFSAVNALNLGRIDAKTCDAMLKVIPVTYTAALDSQVRLPGFTMDEADADALLSRMEKDNNTARQIMAKFNVRVIYVQKAPINFALIDQWHDDSTYVGKVRNVRMEVRLDSIEFFEDKEMTKRIYVYQPQN